MCTKCGRKAQVGEAYNACSPVDVCMNITALGIAVLKCSFPALLAY